MIHTIKFSQNQRSQLFCGIWFGSLAIPIVIVSEFLPDKFLILLFAGWFSWTFVEYWLHRFNMHDPSKYKKNGDRHAYHHQHPTEIKISVWQRVIFSVLVLGLCIVFWILDNYFILLAGFTTGILGYMVVHWVLHQSWAQRIFPQLVLFHIHHHCKHPNKCFGISVPWWDFLFGTIPPTNTVISQNVIDFYYDNKKSHED